MVTLTTADKVLKSVYLDVITDQLNNKTNAFYAAIKKGDEEVTGKNAIAVCRYGINGGMGSAQETGNLPMSSGNNYVSLTLDLKNIYGTIEISDKALRASGRTSGTLVNVLNDEMEGLLEAAKFNFARMLWQNGTGTLAKITATTSKTNLAVDSTAHFAEGMIIDVVDEDDNVTTKGHRITKIDRTAKTVTVSPSIATSVTLTVGDVLTLQQSYSAELYGIPYIFDSTLLQLYGNMRSNVGNILPQVKSLNAALTTKAMQEMLDGIEATSGNDINMLLTSFDVRRQYLSYLESTRTNIDYMNVDGGFKAVSYNGIPLIADKFCKENSIFFLNTNDFKLVQLCDWQWIEGENGSILTQLEKSPAYIGTLVKYANLLCSRPFGQGKLSNITIV